MHEFPKGKSPFYPGQPVPVELFVGRKDQIDRIMVRGVGQVSAGKPVSMFIQGEYGIGKSSFAGYVQTAAEKDHNLYGIYVSLGGCRDLEDVASALLEEIVKSGALHPTLGLKFADFFSEYVSKLEFFGVSLNMESLKRDSRNLSTPTGLLSFLRELKTRLEKSGIKGISLVFDEINGITSNPDFAHFIKGLVDSNALAREPMPLLLVLCGVAERRREMIQSHQPIDRIFDIIQIDLLSDQEMAEFFTKAFNKVRIPVSEDAMRWLTKYSAGFPKIMHLVGDAAYWLDRDGKIDEKEATLAVITAADEVGKKYVDQQVLKALRSEEYHSILRKIAEMSPSSMTFNRADIVSGLTDKQKKKFDNFLRRMKQLKVIRQGESRGEWVFINRMVALYIWLQEH